MNLPSSATNDGSDIVDGVIDWLRRRSSPGRPALEAAVLANQAPFLVGWAIARRFGTNAPSNPTLADAGKFWRPGEFSLHLGGLSEDVTEPGVPIEADTDLLAISLQPNSTRALLPVALRLEQARVRVRFLVEYSDVTSRRAIALRGFSCTRMPPPVRLVALPRLAAAYARLRYLWNDRAELASLLMGLGLDSGQLSVGELSKQLRAETVRTLLRGAAIETSLRATSARNVLFVTHRGLLDHLLGATLPAARRFLFLQGVVPDIPPIRTALSVDHAIVGSQLDLPYVRRCGVELDQITISGYPESDGYGDLEKGGCRAELDRACPGAAGRPLVVFTSQYRTPMFPDAARLRQLDVLVECARRMPEAFFAVKLHPVRESWDIDGPPMNLAILKEVDTAKLIKAADVLVTYWSTTALEAVLLGTPLIQLNATGLPDFFDLSARLGRSIARDLDDLVTRLRRTLSGLEPFDAIADRSRLGVTVDGGAAGRAASALASRLAR